MVLDHKCTFHTTHLFFLSFFLSANIKSPLSGYQYCLSTVVRSMQAHDSTSDSYGGLITSDDDGQTRWFAMLSLAKNDNDPSSITGTRDFTWPLEVGARVSFLIHRERQFLSKVERFVELELPTADIFIKPDSDSLQTDFLSIFGLKRVPARKNRVARQKPKQKRTSWRSTITFHSSPTKKRHKKNRPLLVSSYIRQLMLFAFPSFFFSS